MKDFDSQYEQYLPLIYGAIKKLNIQNNKEEYFQVGLDALWEAASKFNPQTGKFEPFAYFYIINRMKSEMTITNKIHQRYILTEQKYLDQYEENASQYDENIALEERYFKDLTVNQRKVMVERFLNNRSIEETAAYLGISIDAVKNRTRDSKKKILEMLQKEKTAKKK